MSNELDALQDLLASEGWGYFKRALEQHIDLITKTLLEPTRTTSLLDVRNFQAQVREARWLFAWPKRRVEELRMRGGSQPK